MPPRSQNSPFDPPYDADVSDLGAPAPFTGEFYCESDDVTRGVSMAVGPPGSLGGLSGEPWKGGLGDSDFYREPDDVTRGVSMAMGSHGGMLDHAWKGAGDFYCSPEDPHRGVSMASNPLGLGGGDIYGDFDFTEPDQLLKSSPVGMGGFGSSIYPPGFDGGKSMDSIYAPGVDFQDPLGKSFESGIQGKYNILNDTERFPEMQRPPPLPTDPFFSLEEANTLRLTLSRKFEPSKIGNDLLDFLENSVSAAILKVRPMKFAVKANVFVDNRMCTVKARVYHTGGSEYALEMQRRSGDGVAFDVAFKKAAKYFDERLYFGSTPPAAVAAAAAAAAPVKPPAAPLDIGDSQPMLDMAGMEELPSMQAEAAAALADFVVAQPSAAAAALCCREAFDRIRRLLQCDKQDVVYPTAQLLSQLAKMSEAGPFITEDTFSQLIVEKVCSKESSLLVKTEFTKVVNTIVQQHADKLSSRAKDSITAALGKATGPGPSNSKLGPELETSPMTLVGGMGGGAVF